MLSNFSFSATVISVGSFKFCLKICTPLYTCRPYDKRAGKALFVSFKGLGMSRPSGIAAFYRALFKVVLSDPLTLVKIT